MLKNEPSVIGVYVFGWFVLLSSVLWLQRVFGSRVGLPKRLWPDGYDYFRSLVCILRRFQRNKLNFAFVFIG